MRAALLHLTACALVAMAPLLPSPRPPVADATAASFPGWPATFEGRDLRPLPPTDLDARFVRDLPGRVKRFTDGEREIVVRWSSEPTRLVHPAAVCFRADGWDVEPRPLLVDEAGRAWGRFLATRADERLDVRERVEDATGASWPEPTAWYWASILGRTSGPAWAWTVARRE
jgi:hypothetical protein